MNVGGLEQPLDLALARRNRRCFRRGSALLRGEQRSRGDPGRQRRRRPDEISTSNRHKILPVKRMVGELMSWPRGSRRKSRSAAPGWQGATTEDIGNI